jgi:hypothetical protein
MMTIRDEQLAILERAAARRWERGFIDEVAADEPGGPQPILERARTDAEELGLHGRAAFERYVKLAFALGPEEIQSRWGWMMMQVLGDTARDGAARLAFIERHLVQRMRDEAPEEEEP